MGTKGFSTPLATLHKFNGWSDVLSGHAAAGNDDGLKDLNFTIGYATKSLGEAMLVYHKFDSVKNDVDFGSEIDLLYKKKLAPKVTLLVKAALYNNESNSALLDTNKYWVMTSIGL